MEEEYVDDFRSYKYFTAKYIKGTFTDEDFKKVLELYGNNVQRSCEYIKTAMSNHAFEKVIHLFYRMQNILQDEDIEIAIVARFGQIDKDNPKGIEDYPRLKDMMRYLGTGMLTWE